MAKFGKPTNLPLSVIRLDPRCQPREEGVNQEHAQEIARAIERKETIDRPHVACLQRQDRNPDNTKPDPEFYVVDGFDRLTGYSIAGRKTIPVEVKHVTSWEEVVLLACGANIGQVARRRTTADKRRAVDMALQATAGKKSDRWIADLVGVDHHTVADRRERIMPSKNGEAQERQTAGGRKIKVKVKPKKKKAKEEPAGSWRDMDVAEAISMTEDVQAALDAADVETLGQLHDKIKDGDTFGLNPGDLDSLVEQLKALMPPPAEANGKPQKGEEENRPQDIDWKHFDQLVGQVVRYTQRVARAFGVMDGPDHKTAKEKMEEFYKFVFHNWKTKLTK